MNRIPPLVFIFLSVFNILSDAQEINRTKEIYFSVLADPFNIYNEIELIKPMLSSNDLTEAEANWGVLAVSALIRFSGYKIGFFIDADSYDIKYVEKADTILSSYILNEDSYPAFVFEKTLNDILLKKNELGNIENVKGCEHNDLVLLAAGLKSLSNKQYDNSIKKLTAVSESKNAIWEKWWANRYMTIIYDDLKQYKKEEICLKKNIELFPDYPYFYEHLSSFYYKQGRYKEALETVKIGATKGMYPNLKRIREMIYAKLLLEEDRENK